MTTQTPADGGSRPQIAFLVYEGMTTLDLIGWPGTMLCGSQ